MERILLLLQFLLLGCISIQVFGQTGTIIKSLAVPNDHQATGITWDGSHLWFVDYTDDLICRVDPTTGQINKQLTAPDIMTKGITWDGTHLWCIGYQTSKLYRIDTTGKVDIELEVTSTPRGIALVNGHLWYSDGRKMDIYELDPLTGECLDTLPAPGANIRGMAWDGHYLWTCDQNLKEFYKIDIIRKKIIKIIRSPINFAQGLTWDGATLWAVDFNSNTLNKISTTGPERLVYLDSLRAHLQYKLTTKNTGISQMTLESWICQPYNSVRQRLLSNVVYSPTPNQIVSDQYGLQFGYFLNTLNPSDTVSCTMEVDVTTYDIRYYIDPDSVGTQEEIPQEILHTYLADGTYYDLQHPAIVEGVREAVGDETNLYWIARNIHDYIIDKIHYVLDGRWDPAPQVLEQGHGSCSEYSILFVAMCRAAGIPARYEAGSHYRGTMPYIDQVYHRWNQFYLPPYGWVHVDVTWDDSHLPALQSRYFGASSMRVFSTTLSGGGSGIISWSYNSANSHSGGKRSNTAQFTWSEYIPSGTQYLIHQNKDLTLSTPYPNPLSEETIVELNLRKTSPINLSVYDVRGLKVQELYSGERPAGKHRFVWNAGTLSPGTYIIIAQSDRCLETERCLLIR